MNGADIWVIQGGCGLGFAPKAGQRERITAKIRWQEFERDRAVEACVVCLVHDTHPPATEFLDDPVLGEDLPNHCGAILRVWLQEVNRKTGIDRKSVV